jgi:uncharacterized membrane protein YkvA (DUF1232 family)
MRTLDAIRAWAQRIKRDSVTLWFAYRHPNTPWAVKGLCVFVVAYALSPIDLIPDFIPVLGYLDDVILLPGLIWLAIRLLPAGVVAESRVKADSWMAEQGKKPTSKAGAALIISIWVLVAYLCWLWWAGRAP